MSRTVVRTWGAVIWPIDGSGCLLVAEQYGDGCAHVFSELVSDDWEALGRIMAGLCQSDKVSRWYYVDDEAGEAFRDRVNRMVRTDKLMPYEPWGEIRTLPFSPTMYAESQSYTVGVIRSWMKAQRLSAEPACEKLKAELGRLAASERKFAVKIMQELVTCQALAMLVGAMDTISLPINNAKAPAAKPADERTGI